MKKLVFHEDALSPSPVVEERSRMPTRGQQLESLPAFSVSLALSVQPHMNNTVGVRLALGVQPHKYTIFGVSLARSAQPRTNTDFGWSDVTLRYRDNTFRREG